MAQNMQTWLFFAKRFIHPHIVSAVTQDNPFLLKQTFASKDLVASETNSGSMELKKLAFFFFLNLNNWNQQFALF